ncbi:uncharacterized protein LOC119651124 isoform X2 [Hermetia illucens]|uniref:uncharacterized protein LOC119651124 isoform X2 n=1 Tax=Hermetia illucens TaxID=343691 RepID=UPI0018CC6988|nr:uncharacterized protein LOC119651124 isoform X2 [Hermetia illucens]
MKFAGAQQPHRADSSFWNDSFGGHTIIDNYSTNSNNSTSSNRNSDTSRCKINCPAQNANITYTKTKQDKIGTEQAGLCGRDERNEIHGNFECIEEGSGIKVGGNTAFDMIRSIPAVVLERMRVQQSLPLQSSKLLSLLHERRQFRLLSCYFTILLILLCVFTNRALCDEIENGSSLGPEFTTLALAVQPTVPPFDNATRGNKKFGDRCEDTVECGFPGSICDPRKKSCQCIEDLPVTNHLDKCGKEAAINESCFFNEQCEAFHFQTECRDNRCVCRFEMSPVVNKDGNVECKGKQMKHDEVERYVDPAMIGVLVGMALMFIIICVVLRLFSRARWRENRTIFNTPNPRLMNVSLLRDNKLMHGQERRGSRMSVRAPSRQPSMASLRPHSPNPSLGKTGDRRVPRSKGTIKSNDSRFSEYSGNHVKTSDNTANNIPHSSVATSSNDQDQDPGVAATHQQYQLVPH